MKWKQIILATSSLLIMASGPSNLDRNQQPREQRIEHETINMRYKPLRQGPQFISWSALSKPLKKLGLAVRTGSLNEFEKALEDIKPEIYVLIAQHLEKCDDFWQCFAIKFSEFLHENRLTIGVGAGLLFTGFVLGRLSISC